jgi:hypothetical protein
VTPVARVNLTITLQFSISAIRVRNVGYGTGMCEPVLWVCGDGLVQRDSSLCRVSAATDQARSLDHMSGIKPGYIASHVWAGIASRV